MSNVEIKFAKMRDDAIIPSKTEGNIGYDVYPCFDEDAICILPHETYLIPTGIKSIIPDGYAMILKDRGSTGSKSIMTNAGVIDSSYRGEWFVAIFNGNEVPIIIKKESVTEEQLPHLFVWYATGRDAVFYPYEKAITQGILVEDIPATITEVKEKEVDADETTRADGNLGSSGK